jgi:sporulation protein YlmC with PRC-barrel domain
VSRRIRVADVIGMPVVTASGDRLGHVVDLELGRENRVAALLVGRRAWLSRLHLRRPGGERHHERIPWRRVEQLTRDRVRVRDG